MSLRGLIIGLLVVLAAALLWLLMGLPGLFSHLAPPAQITLYGVRLRIIPAPANSTRALISRNGLAAVPKLLAQLDGRERVLPRGEAIEVLSFIQIRGCDLGGTEAPALLERLLIEGRLRPFETAAAARCLEAIREHRHFPPGAFDGALSPCESRP
jgi:hypothetical protein